MHVEGYRAAATHHLLRAGRLLQNTVSLFFSESPTNPYLRCVDVRNISRLCRAAGALTCIDSTFATPINQQALALGADLVIHSATKYLAGHNDVLAGAWRAYRVHSLGFAVGFKM